MNRRRALVSLAGTAILVLAAVLAPRFGGPGQQHYAFLKTLGANRAVTATVFDDLVIYENNLGAFSIPKRCSGLGVGYVSLWTQNGRVVVADSEQNPPRSSTRGYQNDPRFGGLGSVGFYWSQGTPPFKSWDLDWPGTMPVSFWSYSGVRKCRWPGVVWSTRPEVTRTTYSQRVCLLKECKAEWRVSWEFQPDKITLTGRLIVRQFPQGEWMKEPEVAFRFPQASSIRTLDSQGDLVPVYRGGCRIYTGLSDPMVRTGRCEHPTRRQVKLTSPDYLLKFDDLDWRRLAVDARGWPKAGDTPCSGWTAYRLHDNTEYPSSNNGTLTLFKGWEGCVTGDDYYHGWRQPRGEHSYRIQVVLT